MRILIIGAGAIAHHHAAAARLIPGAVIHAADPSDEARARFATAFPEATLFDSPAAMLATPAGPGDIAVVAVPPWLHAPLAQDALAAGYHVLCEKPLGRNRDEVEAILAAAARAGRMVGDCAVRFNDQPAMRRAREIIAEGALGRLNLVRMVNRTPRMRPGIEYQPTSRWFLDRDKAGGGVLLDWAVYDLAMLFDVLHPEEVTVHAAFVGKVDGRDDPVDHPAEVESHAAAMMTLGLADGTALPLIYERANGVNGPALSELSVEGTRAGLSWQWLPPYENGQTRVIWHRDLGGRVEPQVETLPMGEHPHYHHAPLLALVRRIAGERAASLDEGAIRFNFAVIAAIYDVAGGGQPVTLRREGQRKADGPGGTRGKGP